MNRCAVVGLAVSALLAAGPPALAQAQPAPAQQPAGQEDFETLRKAFQEAQAEWYKKLDAVKTEDGGYDMTRMPPSPALEYAPRFKAVAEKNPATPQALKALIWLIQNGGGGQSEAGGESTSQWAVRQIAKDFAASPDLKEVMGVLQYAAWSVDEKDLGDLYDAIIAKNPEKAVVARAKFNKALNVYHKAGEDQAKCRQALGVFREVAREYKGEKAADLAAAFIFEIENLQVGMKAPEIVGQDVNGKEIRLSQFLGNVVVIDFWGYW